MSQTMTPLSHAYTEDALSLPRSLPPDAAPLPEREPNAGSAPPWRSIVCTRWKAVSALTGDRIGYAAIVIDGWLEMRAIRLAWQPDGGFRTYAPSQFVEGKSPEARPRPCFVIHATYHAMFTSAVVAAVRAAVPRAFVHLPVAPEKPPSAVVAAVTMES